MGIATREAYGKALVKIGKEKAKELFNLNKGDKIIITGGFPNNTEKRVTNFMKIEEI